MPSRLKLLELHGYKTFANQTPFEFADTITAIVGPNGSGKSNIADSIRWVLGEQSYSLLRGKKTEDMIFSGSENRPRAGMATASITFDNSDGWLPIDFNEVAIARRAYRDGQNEYLINGQRVRLKDVSELLAKSGLAERTYTVIGQGLVDAALSLKAGERRPLFEEAAGIGLYRGRREEAIRRLDITQRNLERVQDILAELRPRLRSLERQAKRAQEYEQVNEDLQVLLHEFYGYHWHLAQQEIAEAQKTAESQESILEGVRQEQIENENKLSEIRQQMQAIRADLNVWHRQLAELHTQREVLNRKLAVAAERDRSILLTQQNTQSELINRQEELSLYTEGLKDDVEEIERFENELEHSLAQAKEARDALEARQAERQAAELFVREIQQELASINTRKGQLQARLSESKAHTERTIHLINQAGEELASAEEEHQRLVTDQESSYDKVEAAQKDLEIVQQKMLEVQQNLEHLENDRKGVVQERDRVEAEFVRLNLQIGLLDQAEASLIGYASGTKLLLEAVKQDRLDDTLGALSQYLDVPAGLEAAITAALGDYLDGVVLEQDPDQALDYLVQGAARGVLIPLTQLNTPRMDIVQGISKEAGVFGLASQLVKTPEKYQAVVELLLNQVYIVRDRRTARRLLLNQPAGVRFVTLRGEIFHASGLIQTSGASDQTDDETILGRARQSRQLKSDRESIITRRGEMDRRLAELNAQIEVAWTEAEEHTTAVENAQKQLNEALSRSNDARIALEGVARKVEWYREQLEGLNEEVDGSGLRTSQFSAELEAIEEQLTQTRSQLRDANSKISELVLDDHLAQVSHWNTHTAVLERALMDARARREERLLTIERRESSIQRLKERLETLDQDSNSLSDEQHTWRQDEMVVAEKIQKLQALIEPAELALEQVDQQQFELQKMESKSRGRLSQAEHFHAQARIKLARRQEALETWRRRIEDDLGLVAFEYVDQVSGPTPLPLGDLVEQLPVVEKLSPELEETIRRQRAQLKRIGPINPEAQEEYHEVHERFEFLTQQVVDLHAAESDVRKVIDELDQIMRNEFLKTFNAVAAEFRGIFTRLFGGGSARLTLTDPDDISETGIDIEARLPGRRTQGLSLLSGGERSLTATALVFALLKVSPTPFCVLDEVDAMLDEVNVGRFRDLLRELSEHTQFIIVTHNRNTVQAADVIYGVTMGRDSVSQVLSLKLDEVSQIVD